jgi:hypothetical protein
MENSTKQMTTLQVLIEIRDNGGFDNFNKWNVKEKAEWVKEYYNCSAYVSKKVATQI